MTWSYVALRRSKQLLDDSLNLIGEPFEDEAIASLFRNSLLLPIEEKRDIPEKGHESPVNRCLGRKLDAFQ